MPQGLSVCMVPMVLRRVEVLDIVTGCRVICATRVLVQTPRASQMRAQQQQHLHHKGRQTSHPRSLRNTGIWERGLDVCDSIRLLLHSTPLSRRPCSGFLPLALERRPLSPGPCTHWALSSRHTAVYAGTMPTWCRCLDLCSLDLLFRNQLLLERCPEGLLSVLF